MPPQGFRSLQRIHDGHNAVVWAGFRDSDDAPVVLKIARGDQGSADRLARFRREAGITMQLQGTGVIALLDTVDDPYEPAMVLEHFSGRSLASIVADELPPVAQAVRIGIEVVRALARVHAERVVHRDVSPGNILWSADDDRVALIDFGISSRQAREAARGSSARNLEGTLAYIAPEQTGRMNRSIDYRADYYGLGATLYHLLTGRPPFPGSDPLELVHAHLARVPVPADQLRDEVPASLAAVLAKLLEKSPDQRYQGPTVLLRDLQAVLDQLETGRTDPDFVPGRGDFSLGLQIPERLYGRQTQTAALLAAFDKVRRGGRDLVLVAGYSGIGKTSLVGEIQQPIATSSGVFLAGKFDQYKRGLPYAAFFDALRGFVGELLGQDEDTVELWRGRIADAVGELGSLLVDPVPELVALLGPQPDAPELNAAESEARFDGLMLRLMHGLSGAEHPVVLFLDDLQWADLATLRLLARLTRDPNASYLLLIGAYRDNEVDDAHPLALTMADLQAQGAPVQVMELGPLTLVDTQALVADSLRRDDSDTRALAAVLQDRTGGNPFFLVRMLLALRDDGLLEMDAETGRFRWDLPQVSRAAVDEDVVGFVSRRLDELPEDARRVLALGALLGASFEFAEVGMLAGWPEERTAASLGAARTVGLLVRVDDSVVDEGDTGAGDGQAASFRYRFLHDRVQQAAEQSLEEEEKQRLRLRVARHLAELPDDRRSERLFDLVGHYVAALPLVTDPAERRRAAEWLLEAGDRAIASAAFAPALRYLEDAVALLPDGSWESDYAFALKLHQQACVAAWLATEFDKMGELREAVIANARDAMDRFPVDEAQIQSLMSRNLIGEAVDLAVEVVHRLGDPLPADPSQEEVGAILMETIGKVTAAGDGALVTMPVATDPAMRAAQRVKTNVFGAAYYGRPMLAPVLGFTVVQRSLEHGPTPETPFGLVVVGLILCSAGEIDGGLGFGQLALAVNDRMSDRRLAYRTLHLWNTHIRMWTDPWRETRDALKEVYKGELAGGDVEFAAFSAFMSCSLTFQSGDPLDQVDEMMTRFSGAILALGQETSLLGTRIQHQAVKALRGESEHELLIAGDLYDERVSVPEHVEKSDASNLYIFFTTKLLLLLMQGDLEGALATSEEGLKWQEGAVSSCFVPIFWFYTGLIAAAGVRVRPDDREALVQRAREVHEKVAPWAVKSPSNQGHRLALLEAQLAELDGDVATATRRYEDAIAGAREQNFLHDEALFLELAAHFHEQLGHALIAQAYRVGARNAYARWGARARVARIDAEHPELVQAARSRVAGGTDSTTSATTTTSASQNLDTAALIKASQALTSRLQLSELVPSMLEVAIEAAGATAAALLVAQGQDLELEAARSADGGQMDLDGGAAALPQQVLRYVARSQNPVVLGDAARDERFGRDPQLAARSVRSLMCVPLSQQGRLVAVLYIEHDKAAEAFPPERVGIVEALAAQAAISIQNARLYENVEQQVRQRTAELVVARKDAEAQRDRADDLLLNMIPRRVAEELKETGSYGSRSLEGATVLFTDFKGFTAASERMTPEALVAELEQCFSDFDEVMDRFGLEKLKTIGDAYMAIGGAPVPNQTHPVDCVLAALALRDYMQRPRPDGAPPIFDVRIGLHTGPLVAGVIGKRRFAYDVWGDTVNTASRMESSGGVGRVNVSAATWALVQHLFVGENRGRIAAKGKGEIEMYFVDGVRPEFSVDGDGRTPNEAFQAALGGA